MADLIWSAVSPLHDALQPGRHGQAGGDAGVVLKEVTGFGLLQVMARRGKWTDVEKLAGKRFGAAPPALPSLVNAKDCRLIWSGPDQFQVLFASPVSSAEEDKIRHVFLGSASVSNQSDGRVQVSISGAKAREMLAKVCSLDLHPTAFPIGGAASTFIDHTNVGIWREADNGEGYAAFGVLMLSTFAESLWHTILDASAEYGAGILAG